MVLAARRLPSLKDKIVLKSFLQVRQQSKNIVRSRYHRNSPAVLNAWHESATQMRSDFAPLERKIEETVERLKAAKDPFLRREVLKELRRLLDEAERAIELSNKPKAD